MNASTDRLVPDVRDETGEMNSRDKWHRTLCWISSHPRILIAAILVLCLGPFINKAVQTDDVLFVRAGQWIQKHPINFFGSQINWWMSATPMWVANCNPPLLSYFLAAVAMVFGWSEIVLHLGCTAVAIVTALGIYSLAERWCQRPMLATCVAIFTPAFLVSSTTLMSDVMMLGFWVWAVVVWDRALTSEKPDWRQFALAGTLAGFAFLIKYSVITLLPLLLLWSILRTRKAGPWLIGLVVPLVILVGYEIFTSRLYGRELFLAAVHYAQTARTEFPGGWRASRIIDMTFAGGSLLPLLFFAPLLWRRHVLLAGAILVPGMLLLTFRALNHVVFYGAAPGIMNNWRFVAQAVVLSAGALHFALLVATEGWQRKDLTTRILIFWIGAVALFATVLNWTVNVRSFLPLVPAAAILMVRRLDVIRTKPAKEGRLLWPLVPAALIALCVAIADYQLAGAARTAARFITAKYKPPQHTLWFEGHGAFQYYMERLGGRPVDVERSLFQPGDMVVVPEVGIITLVPREAVGWVDGLGFRSSIWIRVTGGDEDGPAGFYAAIFGALPFAFGKPQLQNYFVLKNFSTVQYTSTPANPQEVEAGGVPQFPKCSWNVDKRPIYSLKPEVRQRTEEARQLAKQGNVEAAFQLYDKLLKDDPNNPLALIDVGWILATAEKPQLRNGRVAVQMAARAVQLTGSRQLQFMQVLAAAFAEAGQFTQAVKTTRIVMAVALMTGQNEVIVFNQQMMNVYMAGKTVSTVRPMLGNVPIVLDIADTPP